MIKENCPCRQYDLRHASYIAIVRTLPHRKQPKARTMARESYQAIRFKDAVLDIIDKMDGIIDEYLAQGFRLTVRQLYYQLVARDIVENTLKSYKRVASIANDARLAGLLDWDAIEDRTREFIRRTRWNSGQELLTHAARAYHVDMWQRQPTRVFVIIEKEALVGVLEPTCMSLDVPILAARGYPSGTVLREFVISDILPVLDEGRQDVIILHLGDHDPSGIDMSRDLTDRVEMFARDTSQIRLKRIALNMDQIHERKPPPNPAKTTDSRFEGYMQRFGHDSWELDALPPNYLVELVSAEITALVGDVDQWTLSQDHVKHVQKQITEVAKKFA